MYIIFGPRQYDNSGSAITLICWRVSVFYFIGYLKSKDIANSKYEDVLNFFSHFRAAGFRGVCEAAAVWEQTRVPAQDPAVLHPAPSPCSSDPRLREFLPIRYHQAHLVTRRSCAICLSAKFIWAPVYSCTHWLRPRNSPPPSPRIWLLYEGAIDQPI